MISTRAINRNPLGPNTIQNSTQNDIQPGRVTPKSWKTRSRVVSTAFSHAQFWTYPTHIAA